MTEDKTLYFTFTTLAIRVIFSKTIDLPFQHQLQKEIVAQFRPYLSKRTKLPIYSTIRVINRQKPSTYKKHLFKNEIIISLYKIIDPNIIETYYDLSILQFHSLLYQLVMGYLIEEKKSFTLHGSASQIGNRAAIFLGKSGNGKSTIAELLHTSYKRLADDQVLIHKSDKGFRLYQLPFFEKAMSKKSNRGFAVKHVYFVRPSTHTVVSTIPAYKVYKLMTSHITFNSNSALPKEFIASRQIFFTLAFSKNKRLLHQLLRYIRRE